jgi:hypothetical protein
MLTHTSFSVLVAIYFSMRSHTWNCSNIVAWVFPQVSATAIFEMGPGKIPNEEAGNMGVHAQLEYGT